MTELLSQILPILPALPLPTLLVLKNRIQGANAPIYHLFPRLKIGDLITSHMRTPDVLATITKIQEEGGGREVEWLERVPLERLFQMYVGAVEGEKERVLLLTFQDRTPTRKLEQIRTDFVANVSHELRTPLTSLLGFLETMRGPAQGDLEAQARFLPMMQEQALRMSRLVDSLLSLSHLEEQQYIRPHTYLPLLPLLRHICLSLEPLAKQRSATLHLHSPPSLEGLEVLGETEEWRRIVENLLENALKYGIKEGETQAHIHLHVEKEEDRIHLRVQDEGPGIAAQHLPRLTERFYRIPPSTKHPQSGIGLGLSLVKHALLRVEGELKIESEMGKGTVIHIYIPFFRFFGGKNNHN